MINNWRWFISKTLRETIEDRKQIQKMLAAQRDLIKQKKTEELEQSLAKLDELCLGPIDKEALEVGRENTLQTADAILIPYPDHKYRDWVEMFLVVAALVLAFRTFFFQPFKIPTSSMQPTLFGITHKNLINDDTRQVPGKAVRVANWFRGETWYHLKAKGHWKLLRVSPPSKAGLTKPYGTTKLTFEDLDKPGSPYIERTIWYTWFDNPPYIITHNASQQTITPLIRFPDNPRGNNPRGKNPRGENMISKEEFNQGEDVFKFKVKTGDHLFVNRITYNFRNPRRGDISVFTIKKSDVITPLNGSNGDLQENEMFYIKRLVGLGGEQVSISKDRHLIINGQRLTSATRGFEFVYSPNTNEHAEHSVYSGHDSEGHNNIFKNDQKFIYENKLGISITNVPMNYFLMFGDNTASSLDSRIWGAIPKKNVVGISSFVYWPPFSPRFGWSHR
jgi:signal peptidase I